MRNKESRRQFLKMLGTAVALPLMGMFRTRECFAKSPAGRVALPGPRDSERSIYCFDSRDSITTYVYDNHGMLISTKTKFS